MNLVTGMKKIGLGLGLIITVLSFQNCKVKYNGVEVECLDCKQWGKLKEVYEGDISLLKFTRSDTSGVPGEYHVVELQVQQDKSVLAVLDKGSHCERRATLKASKLSQLEKLVLESKKIISNEEVSFIPERLSESLYIQRDYKCDAAPGISCIMLASQSENYTLNSQFEGTPDVPYLSKSAEISDLLNGIKEALLKRNCDRINVWPQD